ncbi:MAG TPA: epoxyqueuosine reductase [bacterium]|nr:epoxyqueuosine reductase [bacterium]
MSSKTRTRHRRFSWLSDWRGIKSALGEMRGRGYPPQPRLNRDHAPAPGESPPDAPWIEKAIRDKIAHHPANSLEFPFAGEKIFDEPIIGFVRGDDPIFTEYKKIIGPHHYTPEEIMAWQARQNGVAPPSAADLAVVSFVMPIAAATRADNARMDQWPSERWAQTRLLGEIFSQTMVRAIVTELMGRGVLAVSPDVTPLFNKKRYPRVGWASPWSHRHMAYAAGLGTFGRHDFLITEKGCAHRLGSFVANLRPGLVRERPADIHAACLHHQRGACLKCAKRCPVGAITEAGHDKEKCYEHVARSLKYVNRNYHIFIYGCGLCATTVPCEARDPVAKPEPEE